MHSDQELKQIWNNNLKGYPELTKEEKNRLAKLANESALKE